MKLIDLIYFRTKFSGTNNLPKGQPFILACNHQSNVDPFIMGISSWQRFSFLAKEELFKTPLMDFIFRGMGAFPIKRDSSDFRALREALKRIKSGQPLILFPEGTRGTAERKKEPQPGVGFLALKSKVPVIPAYIQDSDKALPGGSKWFKFHPVKVYIGEPISFQKGQDYGAISQEILSAIYDLKP